MCHRNSLHPPAPSRRGFILGAAAAALLSGETAAAKEANKRKKPPPKPQNVLSPDAARERLRQGNARYIAGLSQRHDFKHEREALAQGQNPYAAILSCADSRIAPEYAFDSARGDLFVCRVAGNFATNETIASLEYAVAVLGAPLILVLGHDSCRRGSHRIAEGRHDAAGSDAFVRHRHCASGKGGTTTGRGYARQSYPTECDRQRRKAELRKSNPERGP